MKFNISLHNYFYKNDELNLSLIQVSIDGVINSEIEIKSLLFHKQVNKIFKKNLLDSAQQVGLVKK